MNDIDIKKFEIMDDHVHIFLKFIHQSDNFFGI